LQRSKNSIARTKEIQKKSNEAKMGEKDQTITDLRKELDKKDKVRKNTIRILSRSAN
jgi:hypothetical protein